MSSSELVDPMASVRTYLEAEKSDNTRRGYKNDFADFTTWCERQAKTALPAEPIDVAAYISALADRGLKTSTIQRRLSGIAAAHKAAGFETPTTAEGVKATMRGIRRTLRSPKTKKAPTTAQLLVRVIAALPNTLTGLRDRAILLIAFAAALRRSELVAINLEQVDRRERGILLHIGRSKTDQDGKGSILPIPAGKQLRPVEALNAWLDAAGITAGAIFRPIDKHGHVGTDRLTDRSVARIVKSAIAGTGLDQSLFSGHSMRAGFITSSLDSGVDALKIMKQSRHVKVDTLKEYDRRENDFDHHAGEDFL